MPFVQAAMAGFKQGLESAPTNPLGVFLRGILERANQLRDLQMQSQMRVQEAVETKRQTLPLEIQAEREKAKAGGEAFRTALGGVFPGTGGTPPVGSTMNVSSTGEMGLNVPLNPNLTQEESTILGLQPDVENALGQMEQLIPSVGNLMKGAIRLGAGTPFPFVASGIMAEIAGLEPEQRESASRLQSAFMFLRGTIPFQFGGKQLTTQERQIIESILDPTGKPLDVATADLQRYRRIFSRISNAIRNGTVGAQDDLAKSQLTRQLLQEEGLLKSSPFRSNLPQGFSDF